MNCDIQSRRGTRVHRRKPNRYQGEWSCKSGSIRYHDQRHQRTVSQYNVGKYCFITNQSIATCVT